MDNTRFFEIGKIVNTQGLRGEVRVIPTTDEPSRFQLLKSVTVCFGSSFDAKSARQNNETLIIESARPHKQFVLLKFKGIDTINEAERLKTGILKIPPEQALPLGEDEYYIRDLLGLSVFTTNGEQLGAVTDVFPTGANDVYEITDGAGKKILFPAVKAFVLAVEPKQGRITVRLPDGLVD